MNRKELNALEEKMIDVANNYFFARHYLSNKKAINDNNFAILCSYINNVQKAFNKLSEDEQHFINNEYFYEAPMNWWKEEYSVQGYHQIKNSSITHFLEVFHVHY